MSCLVDVNVAVIAPRDVPDRQRLDLVVRLVTRSDDGYVVGRFNHQLHQAAV